MPIIHLKIYEARLTDETEPKLIEDFTQVLVDNFGEGIRALNYGTGIGTTLTARPPIWPSSPRPGPAPR